MHLPYSRATGLIKPRQVQHLQPCLDDSSGAHSTHLPLGAALGLVPVVLFLLTVFLCAVLFVLVMVPTVVIFQTDEREVGGERALSCAGAKMWPPNAHPMTQREAGSPTETRAGRCVMSPAPVTGPVADTTPRHHLLSNT